MRIHADLCGLAEFHGPSGQARRGRDVGRGLGSFVKFVRRGSTMICEAWRNFIERRGRHGEAGMWAGDGVRFFSGGEGGLDVSGWQTQI